jgi:pSer/pThr/pTyr-binding forkhead associated (FHA) protein
MNTVLTLAGSASGGLINTLLVLVLVVAAILLIIAVYLIRSSRRSVSKHAYEPQAAPYQDTAKSSSTSDNKQEGWQRPVISQPLTVPDALKQCPFCGTDVMPGGIFCLYCGQRLPIPAPPGSPFPASQPDEPVQKPEFISSNRPPLTSFDEIDEALARAVEERPARFEEAVDEQPTKVEEAIVVAKSPQPLEEQPTQMGEALAEPKPQTEEQPASVEEAVKSEKQEEPEQAAPEEDANAAAEPVIEPQTAREEAATATAEPEQQSEEPLAQLEEATVTVEAGPQAEEHPVIEEAPEPEKPVEEQPAQVEEKVGPEKPEEAEPAVPEEVVLDTSLQEWIEEQPTRMEEAVQIVELEKPVEEPQPATAGEVVPPAQAAVAENMAVQSGYLILRKLNGQQIKEYPLNKPFLTIGRGRSNDIVIPRDKLTSRLHAVVRYEHNHYALYDERSANGTFVNGDEIEPGVPHILQDGDTIGVGAYEFTYHTAEALMQEVAHVSTANVSVVTNVLPLQELLPEQKREEDAITQEGAGEVDESFDEGVTPARLIAISAAQVMEARAGTEQPQENPVAANHETLFEHLRFTAFHPKEVAVETWNSLLVYTYIESALENIYQDVNLLLRETEIGGGVANKVNPLLPHGTNITIIPECRGVLFNPRRVTLQWSEDWHRSIFRFSARRDLAGLSRNGRINIFAGPLLVGTLRMAMLFEEQERIDPLIEDAAISTKPYQGIFASYSHHDKVVMQACQEMYRTLGFDASLQIDQMRSWQELSAEVQAGIEQAEVFQLFWSEQAAKSEYVRQEWEYALRLNRGESFMRPVYWEVPLVKPPNTLAPFYFSYLPAYAFASSSSS